MATMAARQMMRSRDVSAARITASRPITADMEYSTATACLWVRPIAKSRWWKWPLSAWKGLCPWEMRRQKAKAVSVRGRARDSMGTKKVNTAWSLKRPMMEAVDNTKPRSWEPTSPMNILAGFML